MGLFSKTRTYVTVTTTNLICDTPDSSVEYTLSSIKKGSKTLGSDVAVNMAASRTQSIQRIWDYVNSGHYYYGHSTKAQRVKTGASFVQLDQVLDTLFPPYGVEVTYAVVANADQVTRAFNVLVSWYQYNPRFGVIKNPWAAFVGTGARSLFYFHTATAIASGVQLTGYYNYVLNNKETRQYHSVNIASANLIPIVVGRLHYHVVYHRYNSAGQAIPDPYGWVYDIASNVYPELSADAFNRLNHPFMPVVPIRVNNTDLTRTAVRTGAAYLTSKELLNISKVDILSVAKVINECPDVAEIDHAYVLFGINLREILIPAKRIAGSIEYLYRLLVVNQREMYGGSSVNSSWGEGHPDSIDPSFSIEIRSGGLSQTLAYDHVEYLAYSGSIGPLGTVQMTVSAEATRFSFLSSGYSSKIIFKEQTNDNIYVVATVYNFTHTQTVNGSLVTTNISDVLWDNDDNFIVPLDLNVLNQINFNNKSALVYSSFKLICQSWKRVKTRRFSFFSIFMFIVAIAIAVFAPPAGATLGTMASGAIIAQNILTVVIGTLLMPLLTPIFTKIVSFLGVDLATIIVVVLTVITLARLGANFLKMAVKLLPSAKDLLQITGAFFSGIQGAIGIEIEELTDEHKAFEKSAVVAFEALDDFMKSMKSPFQDTYDLMQDRVKPKILFETPTTFFNRTIHHGNIGVLTLDTIDLYVASKLELPNSQLQDAHFV